MDKKTMKFDIEELPTRHMPLALAFAVLLQAAAIVWWASAKERDAFFLSSRVSVLEARQPRMSEIETQMLERMARIEERLASQGVSLDRIEKQTRRNQN